MEQTLSLKPALPLRRGWLDWLYMVALVCGAGYALVRYGSYMDGYEKAVLVLSAPALGWLGWRWAPIRMLVMLAAGLSLFAIGLYQGELGQIGRAHV